MTLPATSIEALGQHEASGNRLSNRALVLKEVRRKQGQTYKEIAAKIGLEPVETMRRLGDLLDAEIVDHSDVRECKECGNKCFTWVLKPEPVEEPAPVIEPPKPQPAPQRKRMTLFD